MLLQTSPLLALGVLDNHNRPWTTLWGGERGFSRPLRNGVVGVKTLVDRKSDPVVGLLLGEHGKDGEVVNRERVMSGLGIDLDARRRVKVAGRIVGAVVDGRGNEDESVAELQTVFKVDSSLGMWCTLS